jgi:hypothetical protein
MCIVQIIDISPALLQKRHYFSNYLPKDSYLAKSRINWDDLNELLHYYDCFIVYDDIDNLYDLDYLLVARIGKANIDTNAGIMNRHRGGETAEQFQAKWIGDLLAGHPDQRYIYGFIDADSYAIAYELNKDYVVPVYFHGLRMLLPNKQGLSIPDKYIRIPDEFQFTIAQLSYADWENGIAKSGNALLIDGAEFKKHLLNGAKFLSTGDITLPIERIEYWGYYAAIFVNVDDAEILQAFVYPNVIEIIK